MEEPPLELTIREAEADLVEVARIYEKAKASKSKEEIAKAKQALDEAVRILNITYERPAHVLLDKSLTDTIASIEKSRAEVAKAEENLKEAKVSKSEKEVILAERALRKAQIELTISEEYVLYDKAIRDYIASSSTEEKIRANINKLKAKIYLADAIRLRNLFLEQESLEATGSNKCAVCDSDTVQVERNDDTNPLQRQVATDGSSSSESRSPGFR